MKSRDDDMEVLCENKSFNKSVNKWDQINVAVTRGDLHSTEKIEAFRTCFMCVEIILERKRFLREETKVTSKSEPLKRNWIQRM